MVRWADLVAAGRPVLDVAAGKGRHTALMSERGHPVTAIDRDVTALRSRFSPPRAGLEIVEADLEIPGAWPLAGRRFGGIIVARYLHRPLLPVLLAALEPGGALLYETFMVGNERHGRPANPDFLLRGGELLELARAGDLSVVAYEAGFMAEPLPSVQQRIAACRR
jgi:SAM-dependent methyltransferase